MPSIYNKKQMLSWLYDWFNYFLNKRYFVFHYYTKIMMNILFQDPPCNEDDSLFLLSKRVGDYIILAIRV